MHAAPVTPPVDVLGSAGCRRDGAAPAGVGSADGPRPPVASTETPRRAALPGRCADLGDLRGARTRAVVHCDRRMVRRRGSETVADLLGIVRVQHPLEPRVSEAGSGRRRGFRRPLRRAEGATAKQIHGRAQEVAYQRRCRHPAGRKPPLTRSAGGPASRAASAHPSPMARASCFA